MEEEYLPIIGSNYFYPILKLFEELNNFNSLNTCDVQVSVMENGYSASIIGLSVFCLESYLNRTRQIMIDLNRYNCPNKGEVVLKYFENAFDSKELTGKLKELFILRDIIAHNHIWDVKIFTNTKGLRFADEPQHLGEPLYGDKKFREIYKQSKNRLTPILKLNLFPTKIGKSDAITVLKCMYDILLSIEKVDKRYCYISHIPVSFGNLNLQFGDFIKFLTDDGFDEKKYNEFLNEELAIHEPDDDL
jgi:hypothetical protein